MPSDSTNTSGFLGSCALLRLIFQVPSSGLCALAVTGNTNPNNIPANRSFLIHVPRLSDLINGAEQAREMGSTSSRRSLCSRFATVVWIFQMGNIGLAEEGDDL